MPSMHRSWAPTARSLLECFVPLVIECIGDAQNGAELAHDILIAGRELAEAEMLRAGWALR